MARTNPNSGGGSIGGTINRTEIGYGSALDTLTSDALFTRSLSTRQTNIGAPGSSVIIGDWSGVGGSSTIKIDDNLLTFEIKADNAFYYKSGGGYNWIYASAASALVSLGDLQDVSNKTKFLVDDANSQIYGKSDSRFSYSGATVAYRFLIASQFDSFYGIGDIDGQFNQTFISINDITEVVTISNVPAHADDAAAITAGLTTGNLYKTTTAGSTFLKIVP